MNNNFSIVAILNITKDSFSGKNRYLDPSLAVDHALKLIDDGADIIDLGAESTHPDSENISAELEIERLIPVIEKLKKNKIKISVDTFKPEVIKAVLDAGADMINDVTALRNPESVKYIKDYHIPVVIMYSTAIEARAEKKFWQIENPIDIILNFFKIKIDLLTQSGIKKEQIILDPGMGFFLGANPEPSLSVLRNLAKLNELGHASYVSTSYKSFIGSVLNRDTQERAAGTLASEIWSYLQGVNYIRTHNVKDLKDSITLIRSIQKAI